MFFNKCPVPRKHSNGRYKLFSFGLIKSLLLKDAVLRQEDLLDNLRLIVQ